MSLWHLSHLALPIQINKVFETKKGHYGVTFCSNSPYLKPYSSEKVLFVVSVFMAKSVFVVIMGLRVFQKISIL